MTKPASKRQQNRPARAHKILSRTISCYQHTFTEVPTIMSILQDQLGITQKAILRHRNLVGYANGSLLKMLPDTGEIINELQMIGILDENGQETFHGCITFSLSDHEGSLVGMVGYSLEDNNQQTLMLPGTKMGLFNHHAVKRTDTAEIIILTDNILDTLTLMQAGFTNTVFIAVNDDKDNGDMSAFCSLMKHKGVVITYTLLSDSKTYETCKRAFKEIGIKTIPLALPDGLKDVQGFFQAYPIDAKERFMDLMSTDDKSGKHLQDGSGEHIRQAPIKHTEYGFVTVIHGRTYEIRGIKRTETSLKVTIKAVTYEDNKKRFHLDTVDFYSIRSRNFLIKGLCDLFGEDVETITQDMDTLMDMVETYRPESSANLESGDPEMSDEDRKTALSLLKNPDMFTEILTDFETIGYTGEETNKLLCYIAAISRKTEHPLSVMIQSRSAAGKSFLQDSVLSLVPESDFIKYTRLTDQALFYQGKDSLKHKILAIEELDGMDGAIYSIRSIQSSKKITIAYTGKDAVTGKSRTEANTVEGPLMVFITTTQVDIDGETASRFMFVSIDESEEMTRKILTKQRESHTMEGMVNKLNAEEITRKHQNANRLLRPLAVINPYANLLTFNSKSLRARRDHTKYLNLISAIAYLFQYQRETHTMKVNGETIVEYINVTLSDIEKANRIAGEVLGNSLDELSPPSRTLLGLIQEMVKEQCRKQTLTPDAYHFTRRDIREYSGWSDFQVKTHTRQLVELEYIFPVTGKQGKRYVYELVAAANDGALDHPVLVGLVDIRNLQRKADMLKIQAA